MTMQWRRKPAPCLILHIGCLHVYQNQAPPIAIHYITTMRPPINILAQCTSVRYCT